MQATIFSLRPAQTNQSIARTEVRPRAGSVLVDTGGKVQRDADIRGAAIAVGHDIDPTASLLPFHRPGMRGVGPRIKSGVTGWLEGGLFLGATLLACRLMPPQPGED